MMKIAKGKAGTSLTFQKVFPVETKCECGSVARIAITLQEELEIDPVCNLHENKGEGGFWPHDAIAVAVYFCKKCFKPVTLWNQA